MPRIVSLIASSTEIVCALGQEAQLVGRSHECDYPQSILKLPACSETKFNPDGTSYEIDQRVKAILQEGLSVYRVVAEKVKALNPDVILTQTQCEVCAVSLKDVEAATCEWLGTRPKIVHLEPHCLADLPTDIRKVAQAIGAENAAEKLIAQLDERKRRVIENTKHVRSRPTVACIEWIEPLMAAGNWVPEMVEMAGGVNLFGMAGKHSPWMNWEELKSKDPDVIIVMPCGFGIERTLQEMGLLQKQKGWGELKAVKSGRVFVADGNQYFNRPGPRLIDSLEMMAEILHPQIFGNKLLKLNAYRTSEISSRWYDR